MDMQIATRFGPSRPRGSATPGSRDVSLRCGEGLLNPTQAATYLGTSERHLRRLWQERRLPAIKIGRRVRFALRDLDEFIEANRHPAVR